MDLWHNLNEGQGSVISGALTALAAIIAVFFAGKKFSGQIKNLEDALSKSQDLLKTHEIEVGERLNNITTTLGDIEEQAKSLATSSA
jgi:hypothetical protein